MSPEDARVSSVRHAPAAGDRGCLTIAADQPWRGRNDIWFSPRPLLPEHDLSQQADRNEQQGGTDERDQHLRANLEGQSGDGMDERVVDPSPFCAGDARLLFLRQDVRLPGRSFRRSCS